MKSFDYFQPTEIKFGFDRLKEVGEIVAKYGKSCLLVTVESFPALEPVFEKTKKYLEDAGVKVTHFTGAVPNPTTDSITEGTNVAKENGVDVVLGVGARRRFKYGYSQGYCNRGYSSGCFVGLSLGQ
jgi:alcohol dehydrogenase YqhD (iron-dependent ADH family)